MQDFGNTWKNLTDNSQGRVASFVDFDWGVLLQPWSKYRERPADETIFATAYEDPKHMKVQQYLCFSIDLGNKLGCSRYYKSSVMKLSICNLLSMLLARIHPSGRAKAALLVHFSFV